MDKIAEQLKDPSWWFTAFFVGIVASIIAAFLKDWASSIIANFSSTYRKKRAERIVKEQKLIARLAGNFELLIIYSVICVITLLMWMFGCLMFFIVPVTGVVFFREPVFSRLSYPLNIAPDLGLALMGGMTIMFGTLSIVVGYMAVIKLRLMAKALKEYRKQRNLPPPLQ